MAKAGRTGWERCFHGSIKREINSDGSPVVIGRIKVGDGFICAQAKDQWILGDMLDEMVLLVLDYGLHDVRKTKSTINLFFNEIAMN